MADLLDSITLLDVATFLLGVGFVYAWLKGTLDTYEESGLPAAISMQIGLVVFFSFLIRPSPVAFLPPALRGFAWLAGVLGMSAMTGYLARRGAQSPERRARNEDRLRRQRFSAFLKRMLRP